MINIGEGFVAACSDSKGPAIEGCQPQGSRETAHSDTG